MTKISRTFFEPVEKSQKITICIAEVLLFIFWVVMTNSILKECQMSRFFVPTERFCMHHEENHLKYQSSSTHCLKDITKVELSLREIYRMTERRNYRKLYILFSKLWKQAYPPKIPENIIKTTLLCWHTHVTKYPEEEKKCLYLQCVIKKRWQNLSETV